MHVFIYKEPLINNFEKFSIVVSALALVTFSVLQKWDFIFSSVLFISLIALWGMFFFLKRFFRSLDEPDAIPLEKLDDYQLSKLHKSINKEIERLS